MRVRLVRLVRVFLHAPGRSRRHCVGHMSGMCSPSPSAGGAAEVLIPICCSSPRDTSLRRRAAYLNHSERKRKRRCGGAVTAEVLREFHTQAAAVADAVETAARPPFSPHGRTGLAC